MDHGTRIAKALAKGHDRLRQIFNQNQCIELLQNDRERFTPPVVYDSHWYLDKREYSDVIAGKRYKRLVIDDVEGCRLAQLKAATGVRYNDVNYKFHGKDSFIGAVPSYEFKIYPLGEHI